jgi:hypothetical protein
MWNECRYKDEEKAADDFYEEYNREALLEDDELSPTEAAFMLGYEESLID